VTASEVDFPDHLLFQQDGALSHYRLDVREFLDEQLSGSWIGCGGLTPWPPRSPGLLSLDFF
jgi:hypothetical protein